MADRQSGNDACIDGSTDPTQIESIHDAMPGSQRTPENTAPLNYHTCILPGPGVRFWRRYVHPLVPFVCARAVVLLFVPLHGHDMERPMDPFLGSSYCRSVPSRRLRVLPALVTATGLVNWPGMAGNGPPPCGRGLTRGAEGFRGHSKGAIVPQSRRITNSSSRISLPAVSCLDPTINPISKTEAPRLG